MRRSRTQSAARLVLALALAGPALALQDPFSPGERWEASASAADTPWTPEDVALAGDSAFVWVGLRGGDHALELYDGVAAGSQTPRGVVTRQTDETTVPVVAAGSRGDRVFALRQSVAVSVFRRIPCVFAYDPLEAGLGEELAPVWHHDMGLRINGATRIATDRSGELVAAAVWDDSRAVTRVDLLSGDDGALLGRAEFPSIGLSGLDVSADGSRIAVVCGLELHVLDARADLVHTEPLTSSTSAVSLSANGSTVAFGQLGALRTISDLFGFGYGPGLTLPAIGAELPSRIDLSADGTMIAAAWWNYSSGSDVRFEIFDTIFGFALGSAHFSGFPDAQQNLPTSVRITDDGLRAVMTTWGNGQDAELVVLDAGGFGPTLSVDLPGSARAVAMDATGTRFAVAHKDVHAQSFGAAGAVRFIDSGERSLQTIRTPRIGGELSMAARLPGASGGFFLLGAPGEPITFPGVAGELLLDRRSLRVLAAAVDGTGRMDLNLPIGSDASLLGLRMNVQGAFRTPQGFALTERLERPYVLR